ncbi:MAG: hypothetical protein LC687_01840 [Actinobacteria bacterium]|nr:hypothetical protein [Actinomycetota bacterium]
MTEKPGQDHRWFVYRQIAFMHLTNKSEYEVTFIMRHVINNMLLFLYFISTSIYAAEMKIIKGDNLLIEGEIEQGDYGRLVDVVVNYGKIPSAIAITSSGGDIVETMKIGRFIRQNHLYVFVIQPCDSACAFIAFSAVTRIGGEVGLHRPYYDPAYFSKLNSEEASNKYKELDKEVRLFLAEMNVPTIIIDKIFSIPSSEIEQLKINAYNNLAGESPPAQSEWLAARCGAFEENERQDYKYTSTLVAHQNNPDIEIDPAADFIIQSYIDAAKELPPGYRNYLYTKGKKIVDCENKAIDEERKNNYKKLMRTGQ